MRAAGADTGLQTDLGVLLLVLSEPGSQGEHFLGGAGVSGVTKRHRPATTKMYTIVEIVHDFQADQLSITSPWS